MRADPVGGRTTVAPAPLSPATFCRLLTNHHFPDLGFLEVVSATFAPWHEPAYLVHLTLRHHMTRRAVRKTLIVRPDGESGETVFRSARELWARVFCRSDTLSMGLPLGYIPEHSLLLQALPDGATLQDLLRERRESALHAGIRTLARWLAKLHDARQGCEALPIQLDADRRQELQKAQKAIVGRLPQERTFIADIADTLDRVLASTPNPLLPSLGAVDLSQIYFHSDILSPVNFARAGLGDPAADLGMACAAIEAGVIGAGGADETVNRLQEAFSSEYRRHGGLEPFNRIKPYMAFAHVNRVAEAVALGPVDPQWIRLWLDRAAALL